MKGRQERGQTQLVEIRRPVRRARLNVRGTFENNRRAKLEYLHAVPTWQDKFYHIIDIGLYDRKLHNYTTDAIECLV